MAFDIDVLIVFADKDNNATKAELGWVSQFKKFLELMLNQVLGEKCKILLKAEHDPITAPTLKNIGALVAVLSKEFIQSGQCLDNVESFCQANQITDKAHTRLFKVFKTPLTNHEQPPRLRDLIGYDMFQLDTESGEIKEYVDYFSLEAERQYWMKMVDLAYDIYDSLLLLKDTTVKSEVKNIFRRKVIYLAETGHDLSVQRNIIKRELQRHGYIVLPNQTLPASVTDLEKVVKRDLVESNLSIHLIGTAYGEIPEGSERSVVDIQNKLAAEKSVSAKEKNEEFTRLIWISPNMSNASEKQKGFIENIKRDVEAQEGAEILQTPLEDFKNIMREELVDTAHDRKVLLDDNTGRSIYLMHDKVDDSDIAPIKDAIEKSGFKVLLPEFEGELLELRQKHIDNLRNFDAAIIYKGKVNEQWVRMKALDILKAPGFGRKKPIIGKAIITTPGSKMNLDSFKSQNLRVIESDPNRPTESLKSFLQEFNA
jgi:hypothetical protein